MRKFFLEHSIGENQSEPSGLPLAESKDTMAHAARIGTAERHETDATALAFELPHRRGAPSRK